MLEEKNHVNLGAKKIFGQLSRVKVAITLPTLLKRSKEIANKYRRRDRAKDAIKIYISIRVFTMPIFKFRLLSVLGASIIAIFSLIQTEQAFAQVFFRMNYSSAAQPSGAWPSAVNPSSTFSRAHIAGAGPQGEDVYELNQLGSGMSGGNFYWGWNGYLEGADPSQGSRRFYRWRMRFSPTTNFRGIHWSDGDPTTITNKLLMIGDGCGRNRCRVIVTYRGSDTGNQAQYMRIQLDGGEDPADTPPISVGEWFNIQIEVDSSTTTSSGDGSYKIWINNNNYSQPTAQRTNIQLNPVYWRYIYFGAYNNDGLAPGGVHSWRQTGFEAATSFDPAWNRSGTGGSTLRAPSNLRVI